MDYFRDRVELYSLLSGSQVDVLVPQKNQAESHPESNRETIA